MLDVMTEDTPNTLAPCCVSMQQFVLKGTFAPDQRGLSKLHLENMHYVVS